MDEGGQEEYSSVDLVDVIAFIRKECDLPLALSEGQKIWSFCAGLDADNSHLVLSATDW